MHYDEYPSPPPLQIRPFFSLQLTLVLAEPRNTLLMIHDSRLGVGLRLKSNNKQKPLMTVDVHVGKKNKYYFVAYQVLLYNPRACFLAEITALASPTPSRLSQNLATSYRFRIT